MKKKIKFSLLVLVPALFIVIIYMFLWGKLFPYSPVITGFEKHEFSHAVIYIQNGSDFNDYIAIDTLIPGIEKFHEMKYLKKPEIFIFKDSLSYLHRSISKARFCAFTSGRLVVSPWAIKEARKGTLSLSIYLRHELSHVLIYNYTGIWGFCKYPDWLLEGTAMYSANQLGTGFYPGKLKTYELIKKGNFIPPQYYKTNKEGEYKIKFKYPVAFMYSEFGYIVDYLISNYGKDKFIQYVKCFIDESNADKVSIKVYRKSFADLVSEFRKYAEKN